LLISFFLACYWSVVPTVSCYSPFLHLGLSTSLVSCSSLTLEKVRWTEVSAFQGGGLANVSSILRPLRLGSHFLVKLTVILSFVFFLV